MKNHMAIDQYDNTWHDLGQHPRKELCRRLGKKHVDKMYIDTAKGPCHIGYIIGTLWLTLYKVERIA
jgi:hypothetical protein